MEPGIDNIIIYLGFSISLIPPYLLVAEKYFAAVIAADLDLDVHVFGCFIAEGIGYYILFRLQGINEVDVAFVSVIVGN